MKPTAPSKPFYIIGMICGILGGVSHYYHIQGITPNIGFLLLLAGFVALAVGTTFKGV